MTAETLLRTTDPTSLRQGRLIAHQAVQLVTKAARANLPAAPDDSHSNMGWDASAGGFVSQPITKGGATWHVSVSLAPLTLNLIGSQATPDTLDLVGMSMDNAVAWLDDRLQQVGLAAASGVRMPYLLPWEGDPDAMFRPDPDGVALEALSAWFGLADELLSDFAKRQSHLNPGPSPVRCWPHHFDLATYVGLEPGDHESARGIGVGLSPGDETYEQPYFYVNPWPHLEPGALPDPPLPGHWHTAGFVGAIATMEEVLTLDDIRRGLTGFIETAFATGNRIGSLPPST